MTRVGLAWSMAVVAVALGGWWIASAEMPESSMPAGIPPEIVADYIHDVIQADRTAYTVHVVERMQTMGVVVASENWHERPTLPLPAQLLLEAAHAVAAKPHGIRYRLISLWPINRVNGPADDFERRGLEEVRTAPERPYTGIQDKAAGRFFEAVYADRAVTQACIGCHNAHASSPRRDFKRDEVMGGIVISIPLGTTGTTGR